MVELSLRVDAGSELADGRGLVKSMLTACCKKLSVLNNEPAAGQQVYYWQQRNKTKSKDGAARRETVCW